MRNELPPKEHIYRLEDQLLKSEIRQSKKELENLLAEDFVEFGSSGRIYDKAQIVRELPMALAVPMIIKDFQVKVLSKTVILSTYCIVKKNGHEEIIESLRSSIWKFLDGRWQIIFHQGTKLR